jgi:hypothetical protein
VDSSGAIGLVSDVLAEAVLAGVALAGLASSGAVSPMALPLAGMLLAGISLAVVLPLAAAGSGPEVLLEVVIAAARPAFQLAGSLPQSDRSNFIRWF